MVAWTPPSTTTTAAHSSTKSTVGRSTAPARSPPAPTAASPSKVPPAAATSAAAHPAPRASPGERQRGRCLLGDARLVHDLRASCPYWLSGTNLTRVPAASLSGRCGPGSPPGQLSGEKARERQCRRRASTDGQKSSPDQHPSVCAPTGVATLACSAGAAGYALARAGCLSGAGPELEPPPAAAAPGSPGVRASAPAADADQRIVRSGMTEIRPLAAR